MKNTNKDAFLRGRYFTHPGANSLGGWICRLMFLVFLCQAPFSLSADSEHIFKVFENEETSINSSAVLFAPMTASGSGINAAKTVTEVANAESGTLGNLDITFEIVLQNTAIIPLTNISIFDTLDLNKHLGPAFVGISPSGAPTIVSSDADINPTINNFFDGTAGESNIFNGLSGLLQVNQSITVRYTVEINPFLAIDPEFLYNQASVSGTDMGIIRCDLTDSGTDPTGSNPGADGDTGGSDDPTPVNVCSEDCELACKEQVHVSLNQNCETIITVGMVGAGIPTYCEWQYDVVVSDHYGNAIPNNLVDVSMVGQNLDFWLTKEGCNNSCEGKVLIEYKLPPKIDCPGDITLSCGALEFIGLPAATGGCAPFEVILFNETRQALQCDPLYTHIVERTYKAIDDFGNESVCSHTIYVERVDLSEIYFPEPFSLANGNPISCDEGLYELNENGVPVPWPTGPDTGSGTGVPVQCDPLITGGLICPATGSGTGVPLIPGNKVLCSAVVLYTDIEFPEIGCVRKIMRTWEVREWWCNGENSIGGIQMIEIIDDEAPEFSCPPDFSVTTNDDCAGSVVLPPVNPVDGCGHGFEVRIDFPLGFINGNGGVAELEVGVNDVTYIVNDACYNTSSCTMQVSVADDTEPVTICDPNTVVSISMQGNTIVAAEVFDDGSWDECGLDSFAIRRMDTTCVATDTLFGKFVSFCCSDVGQDVMVVFRAVDKGGNHNDCMVRVEVQDKIAPTMTCPTDMSIDCRDPYDINNLGVTFGNPTIMDNCMNLEDVFEIVTPDVNQCGIGELTRLFELRDEDGKVLRTCKQFVEVINTAPFVESNILWPLDYSIDNVCGLNALRPNNLPVDFAFPRYTSGDDECSLLGYDYEDEVYEANPGTGECAHIERTWRVINWCSQVNGQFEVFEIPTPQMLILNNTIAPELVPVDDILFESGNIDCVSGDIEMVRQATNDCPSELQWYYEIRDTFDVLIGIGTNDTVMTVLPVGFYDIYWRVEDGCGNFDVDTVGIEVRNTKSPSPICMQGLSVNIDISMEVSLNVDIVDGGSYHTCNNPITLSMTQDTSVKTIIFDCDDVGMQLYQLWVTDLINGAQDYCSAFIDVQDPDDVCPVMSNVVTVSGDIHTEELEMIEAVTVDLTVPDIFRTTDSQGYYAFENMPMGGSYNVIPKKDKDYLNGVSTLDLIIIQRHILGIELLDSPYKMIAADVNNSKDISAIDLIELRKLILGVYQKLPQNYSWRFVDENYNFPELLNPWVEVFPETYLIESLNENMFIDFVGVKVGDVNGSATVNNSTDQDDNIFKYNQEVLLAIEPGVLQKGESHTLKFYANSYDEILGWQGTLEFDPDKIEILSVQGRALNISEDNINLTGKSEGWMTLSYHNPEAESNTGKVLFEVYLYAKEDLNTTDIFTLNSDLTRSEAYAKNNKIIHLGLDKLEETSAVINSVQPNPWVDQSEISFSMPQQGMVDWEFYDVAGRLLLKKSSTYSAGTHTEKVRAEDFNASGVIYVKMITDGKVNEVKMLKIK